MAVSHLFFTALWRLVYPYYRFAARNATWLVLQRLETCRSTSQRWRKIHHQSSFRHLHTVKLAQLTYPIHERIPQTYKRTTKSTSISYASYCCEGSFPFLFLKVPRRNTFHVDLILNSRDTSGTCCLEMRFSRIWTLVCVFECIFEPLSGKLRVWIIIWRTDHYLLVSNCIGHWHFHLILSSCFLLLNLSYFSRCSLPCIFFMSETCWLNVEPFHDLFIWDKQLKYNADSNIGTGFHTGIKCHWFVLLIR